jgi:hypothetical protein
MDLTPVSDAVKSATVMGPNEADDNCHTFTPDNFRFFASKEEQAGYIKSLQTIRFKAHNLRKMRQYK